MFDIFEKTMINKVRMQGKEFKMWDIKKDIEDRHKDFKGKQHVVIIIRFAFD
jgi:hypothetical protein